MTTQRGQVFRLDDGSWAFRYRNLPGRKPSRPQKGGFATKKEATKALDDQLRRLRLGTLARASEPLRNLTAEYMAQYDRDAKTVEWFQDHIDRINAEYGDWPLEDLEEPAIAKWLANLKRLDGKPLKSRHQTAKAFKQVLAAAVRWRWIEASPLRDMEVAEPRREEIVPFTDWAEVEKISVELGARGGQLVLIAAGTGLRPQELFGLEWRDVDLAKRTVRVERVWLTQGELKPIPKTDGSRRTVPLRQRVVAAFEAQGLLVPRGRRDIVFPAEGGGRTNLDNWRRRFWSPALEMAGIENRGPYHLRHTYATWSLAAGVGTFALARRMGTSLQMIQKTYGHLAVDADDAERDMLDAWDGRGES